MESKKVGTQVKATYKESQWGGSSATFKQTVPSKQEAQKRAEKEGWELVDTKEVPKYELVK